MPNKFLVSVADAVGLDPTTKNALFFGTANMNSAFDLSMASTDVRGGRNNALLYKHFHDRDLSVTIEQATFEKTFMALNVGESILNQTVEALETDCVQLTGGTGTLSKTPIGDVNIFKSDGTVLQVTPSGTSITVPATGDEKVTAVYKYSDTVDRLPIGTKNPPSTIDLYLIADVRDSNGVLVEKLSINVPSFQIDGSYSLSFSADGVSSESLSGMALSVEGESCSDGDIYAYVDWIPQSTTSTTVAYIASTPSDFEPVVGDLPSTQQITVNAFRNGVYQPFVVTSDSTFSASGDADITVDANGLITVSGSAIATDTSTITVTYNDGVTDHVDYVIVTVQA